MSQNSRFSVQEDVFSCGDLQEAFTKDIIMAPFQYTTTGVLKQTNEISMIDNKNDQKPRECAYLWKNVFYYISLHISSLYAVYLVFCSAKLLTVMQVFILLNLGDLGVTCGAHRLWSHKSYKAKTPLKIILVILETLAFENTVIKWARDHRVHHRYTDTDADPYNAERGFFFAHAGWFLSEKHPDVEAKLKTVDVSDLTSDPILSFQQKHFKPLFISIAFLLPTVIPMYFWGETFQNAWFLNLLRYCLSMNFISLINSAAHHYGRKPYDRHINPAENFSVALLAMGEGWHNYHHAFPWDYKASELGKYSLNWSTAFIDFFAKIGWAYDLKVASKDVIKKRILKTGDGTHPVWGSMDKDI
ncbi:Desat1 [Trypoxylus dichotomus]